MPGHEDDDGEVPAPFDFGKIKKAVEAMPIDDWADSYVLGEFVKLEMAALQRLGLEGCYCAGLHDGCEPVPDDLVLPVIRTMLWEDEPDHGSKGR